MVGRAASMRFYSLAKLVNLSTNLSAVEDWLNEKCSARHADEMADVVHEAWQLIDELYDACAAEQAGPLPKIEPTLVYIILEGPDMGYYGGAEILGVHTSREAAEARLRKLRPKWTGEDWESVRVEEWQ